MRRFLRLNRHYGIYSYAFFTIIYTSYHDQFTFCGLVLHKFIYFYGMGPFYIKQVGGYFYLHWYLQVSFYYFFVFFNFRVLEESLRKQLLGTLFLFLMGVGVWKGYTPLTTYLTQCQITLTTCYTYRITLCQVHYAMYHNACQMSSNYYVIQYISFLSTMSHNVYFMTLIIL